MDLVTISSITELQWDHPKKVFMHRAEETQRCNDVLFYVSVRQNYASSGLSEYLSLVPE